MNRIGLFGGSFDPVHAGHLLVARAAIEELALDKMFFIPAAQSPFKPSTTPASPQVRERMLRMSLAGWNVCEIDMQEIARGGVSYSIDTVRGYVARFPESKIYYLIGADHVPTLPKWRDAEQLAGLVEFVVIQRPGEPAATLPPPYRVSVLGGWPLKLSSSEIRARVNAGKAVDGLVPPGVAQVIAEESLYLPA